MPTACSGQVCAGARAAGALSLSSSSHLQARADAVEAALLLNIRLRAAPPEEFACFGLVVGDGRQGRVRVAVAGGIPLDLEVDQAEPRVKAAPSHELDHRLRGITRIKAPSRLDWQARPPVAAELETHRAALERMNALDPEAAFEPGDEEHHVRGADPDSGRARRRGAAQDRLDVVERVVAFPRKPVRPLPLFPGHARVVGGAMVEV